MTLPRATVLPLARPRRRRRPPAPRAPAPGRPARPAPPPRRSTRSALSPHQPQQYEENQHGDHNQHPPDADGAARNPLRNGLPPMMPLARVECGPVPRLQAQAILEPPLHGQYAKQAISDAVTRFERSFRANVFCRIDFNCFPETSFGRPPPLPPHAGPNYLISCSPP